MKLNKEELNKKISGLVPIDLNLAENVDNNEMVQIFQHPHGNPISASYSQCQVVSKFGYMDS